MHKKLTKSEREALQAQVLSQTERVWLMSKECHDPYKNKKLNADRDARALLEADDLIRKNDLLQAINLATSQMGAEEQVEARQLASAMVTRYQGCTSIPQADAVFHRYKKQSLPEWAEKWNEYLHESRRVALAAA